MKKSLEKLLEKLLAGALMFELGLGSLGCGHWRYVREVNDVSIVKTWTTKEPMPDIKASERGIDFRVEIAKSKEGKKVITVRAFQEERELTYSRTKEIHYTKYAIKKFDEYSYTMNVGLFIALVVPAASCGLMSIPGVLDLILKRETVEVDIISLSCASVFIPAFYFYGKWITKNQDKKKLSFKSEEESLEKKEDEKKELIDTKIKKTIPLANSYFKIESDITREKYIKTNEEGIAYIEASDEVRLVTSYDDFKNLPEIKMFEEVGCNLQLAYQGLKERKAKLRISYYDTEAKKNKEKELELVIKDSSKDSIIEALKKAKCLP
ncbi:MAG: hypothetical protein QXS07_01570 [Candidatus Pacearchaeota archaeon]